MSDTDNTNAQQFLSRLRDHYVDQLVSFIREQRTTSTRGEAEVKIELEPGSNVFRSMACAAFVRNDNEPEIVELASQRALSFEPVSTELGGAKLRIEQLRWDDVLIEHDAAFDPEEVLGTWFDRWFDPQDRRYNVLSDTGNVIHSVAMVPSGLHIDFGSAAPEAFWELLNVLERAGATKMRVAATSTESA